MGVRFSLWAVDSERLLGLLTPDEVSNARQETSSFEVALRRVAGTSDARGVVQLLLDGHRRWWIGSLVESLRRSPWLVRKTDAEHMERLLSAMLGKFDCGTTIRGAPLSADRAPFPIVPRSDTDLHLSVLSPSDFEFLRLAFAELLQEDGRRFARPSGKVGIAPDSDDEWDGWVRKILKDISTTPLEVPNPTLVSFLG